MSWKMLGKTFRIGSPGTELWFDHIDTEQGYFCGTHNFVEFYVLDAGPDADDTLAEDLADYGMFRGQRIGDLGVVVRGKLAYHYGDYPPYGNVFDLVRRNLEHRCGCPTFVKTYPMEGTTHQGAVLANRMREEAFPEAMEVILECPDERCRHPMGKEYTLWSLVQHLNDTHHWSREEIADWLETLDVDLSFPVPSEVPKEPGEQ